ncbi:MAG TPA: glycine cleavage system protein GcvH [Thermodesulfobacteriota bacterium]|nr:glycine cleavage system protein GcvH [Thermodesulfobacteriota bacterium]
MVEIPEEFKYTKEHEWTNVEKDLVIIGITDYAQEALGEIVYIELPSEGDEITKGDPFGAVESTKAVSDLYAPISGEVVEVNEVLFHSPESINEDPYGNGWMIKVKPYDTNELKDLMEYDEYTDFVEKEMEK